MDGDPLTQCFVCRLAERIVEIRFSAQDQCKVVHGIVAVVHEHLDVIENAGVQILGFINGEEERLALLPVEIGDLFLDCLKHACLAAFVGDTEDGAELFVKVGKSAGRSQH